MSGICGVVAIDIREPIDVQALKRMTEAMAHRGPDGEGVWVSSDNIAGLGHRRLATLDLTEAGQQPIHTDEGDIAIVHSGEIYNRRKIRESLGRRGYEFKSKADTEALLYLYKEGGPEFVELLEGDYAFAVWDNGAKRLTLGRDRAGMRPLYYAMSKGYFVFASEIRAILASGLVEPEINEEALYHYMTYLVSPPGTTMIKGIRKLEAATVLTVTATGGITRARYWSPLPGQAEFGENDDLDELFTELFTDSVTKRMSGNVPVGILFSGGVDSTLNAGVFGAAAQDTELQCFTAGLPGSENDERLLAKKMAEQLGATCHETLVSDAMIMTHLDTITTMQDEPVSDPSAMPLYFVAQLARSKGVTVLQSGDGADELFCGYDSWQRYLKHYRSYWQNLSRLPGPVTEAISRASGWFAGASLRAARISDMTARLARGDPYFLSSSLGFYESEKRAIMNPDYLQRMSGLNSADIVAPFYAKLDEDAPDATFLQRMTFIELNMRLPEVSLMRADKMSSAHGLEIRAPFLDHRLIEFAMSVPDSFKLRDGITKEPVKRLAAKYAPRADIYAHKPGFKAPVSKWFGGVLGDSFRAMIEDADTKADAYFNTDVLKSRLDGGLASHGEAFQLWVIYNFLNWKNLVFDEHAEDQVADEASAASTADNASATSSTGSSSSA